MLPYLRLLSAILVRETCLAAARSGGVLLLVAACLPTHAARAAACPASTVDELYACLDQLAPGDSLEVAPGRYEVSGISLEGINGEPDLPITLEGTGDGVVIVGVNLQANVISLGFMFSGWEGVDAGSSIVNNCRSCRAPTWSRSGRPMAWAGR